MHILAPPANREALISSGALPWCAAHLQQLMATLSESATSAAWESGIEYRLWLEIQSPPAVKKHKHYAPSNAPLVAQIQALSQLIDGWVLLLDTPQENYLYLPAFIWEHHCHATQSDAYRLDLQALQAARHNDGDIESISEDELKTWVRESNKEALSPSAGQHFEPMTVRRRREAFAAYFAWRDGHSNI
jgi:hypothetical protein